MEKAKETKATCKIKLIGSNYFIDGIIVYGMVDGEAYIKYFIIPFKDKDLFQINNINGELISTNGKLILRAAIKEYKWLTVYGEKQWN